jgi:hypothetical protein
MERNEKVKEVFRSASALLRILDMLFENMKIPHTHHDDSWPSTLSSHHNKSASLAGTGDDKSDDGEMKKQPERGMVTTAGCLVRLLFILMTHDTNVNDLKAVLSFVSGKWPMPICDGGNRGETSKGNREEPRAYHSPHFCELCRSKVLKMLLQVARVDENSSRFGRFVLWGHNAGLKVPENVKWPKWGMSFFLEMRVPSITKGSSQLRIMLYSFKGAKGIGIECELNFESKRPQLILRTWQSKKMQSEEKIEWNIFDEWCSLTVVYHRFQIVSDELKVYINGQLTGDQSKRKFKYPPVGEMQHGMNIIGGLCDDSVDTMVDFEYIQFGTVSAFSVSLTPKEVAELSHASKFSGFRGRLLLSLPSFCESIAAKVVGEVSAAAEQPTLVIDHHLNEQHHQN